MRLFLFLSLFFLTMTARAQSDCDDTSFAAGTTFNCANVRITLPLNLSARGAVIVINSTGTVEINSNIILDGAAGANQPIGFTVAGGTGGPGATNGGGMAFGATVDGEDGTVANGKAAPNDLSCGNGGGGGGLLTAGSSGNSCTTSTTAVGAGGAIAPNTEFNFGGFFRGGYGGGPGGDSNGAQFGTGGGGGGALRINVTGGGNVIIASGVSITARGGNGGPGVSDGGGGGGGSGGAVWIQTTGRIVNNGTLDLRGGTGGVKSGTGGSGGNGGDGAYRLQDLTGTINGSGLRSPPAAETPSLKSSIGCGTLKDNDSEQNMFMQMMMGMALVFIFKILFRRQMKI